MDGPRPVRSRVRPTPRGSAGVLLTNVAWWLLAIVCAAVVLRVADFMPSILLGTPHGGRRFARLADLERAAGRTMPVPAYYPSSIEWPPGDQRLYPPASAAFWCRHRTQGAVWLVVATAPAGAGAVASQVLPPASELQRGDGEVRGQPAIVARLRDADGAVWQQVSWTGARGVVLLRYRGTLDELMRMAASMSE
ncbi:MAG: hypothetical protein NTY02_11615 [Acidobacteria bacterium]|nr:hypothetical protein [Acidobacteriota bacterium]